MLCGVPEHRFCPASRGPGHLLQEGPSGAAPGAPAACSPRCLFAHLVPLWDVGQGPGTDSDGAVVETQSCGAEDLLPPPGDAGEEPGASGALLCARARRDTGGPGLAATAPCGAVHHPNPTEQVWSPKQHAGLGVPKAAWPRDAPCQGEGPAPAQAVRWQRLCAGSGHWHGERGCFPEHPAPVPAVPVLVGAGGIRVPTRTQRALPSVQGVLCAVLEQSQCTRRPPSARCPRVPSLGWQPWSSCPPRVPSPPRSCLGTAE